ncbi:MAG: YfbM family protein [Vulcanimicrobiaceae bacterium]
MPITARFLQITDDVLAQAAEDPALIRRLFSDQARRRLGIAPVKNAHGVVGLVPRPRAVGSSLALDGSWHGVHYLLCGTNDAGWQLLSRPVLGGSPIGDDLGHGSARFFGPNHVLTLARALRRANIDVLRSRFDPSAMSRAGIYPGKWRAQEAAWLVEEMERLRQFYADAAQRGYAMLTVLR